VTIKKINWTGYPPYRQSVYDQEELTALELAGRTTHTVNNVIGKVNTLDKRIRDKEDSSYLTNKRKLSEKGNFTGLIAGRNTKMVIAGIDNNEDKIQYISNQFADGQTGLIVDGGWFEESGIKKNYDGGRF